MCLSILWSGEAETQRGKAIACPRDVEIAKPDPRLLFPVPPYLGELLTLGVAWGMGRGGGDSQKAELGYCGSSSLIFSGSGDR